MVSMPIAEGEWPPLPSGAARHEAMAPRRFARYTGCMWQVWALAALLVGCGGSTRANANDEGNPGGSAATGGTATGGTATGGRAGSGAAAPMDAPEWLQELNLDDNVPWFVGKPGDPLGPMLSAEGMAADKVVHVVLADSPVQAVISTHNHFDVLGPASAVRFSAKATREAEILVSVRRPLDADYFSALAAGKPWQVASVAVGPTWQDYEVAFADMKPPEVAEPSGTASFMIAFIVDEESAPFELWLDEVNFK